MCHVDFPGKQVPRGPVGWQNSPSYQTSRAINQRQMKVMMIPFSGARVIVAIDCEFITRSKVSPCSKCMILSALLAYARMQLPRHQIRQQIASSCGSYYCSLQMKR